MKKHGFTLAEVLITLSIIAIAAATLAPLYLQAKPDRYKFKVINYYNRIDEATDSLLSNPAIYHSPKLSSSATNPENFPVTGLTNPGTGDCKYPNLMKQLLNLTDVSACSNGKYEGISSDGTSIKFEKNSTINSYDILLTFPQPFGSSCSSTNHTYDSNTCKNPYAFKLTVSNSGDVMASDDDPLTEVFINNMFNIHRHEDYDALTGQ